MKSKKVTYLLIAVLVVVWGKIAKSVFFDAPPSQELNTQVKPVPKTKKTSEPILIFNYPDPFFVAADEKQVIENRDPISYSEPQSTYREELNAFYAGKIKSGQSEYYLIVIDGTTQTFSKGQIIDGIKLIGVIADSVLLEKNRHRYSLAIQ